MAEKEPGVRIVIGENPMRGANEYFDSSVPGLYNQISKKRIKEKVPYQSDDWVDTVYDSERHRIFREYEEEEAALRRNMPEIEKYTLEGLHYIDKKAEKEFQDALDALQIKYFGEKRW